jgi:hypothetical protein
LTDTRSISKLRSFDPAGDGFGFRNPVGKIIDRTGGGLLRRFDSFAYGKGLCFGMAFASLFYFMDSVAGKSHRPLSELSLTPGLLTLLCGYQLRQFRPRTIIYVVWLWLASGGGRAGRASGRLRLAGESPDPHILCFGPSFNSRFFYCLARAHAVVPYRSEEGQVYVYDPNYPGDRRRAVELRREGFAYDGFRSSEGWGLVLLPLSACSGGHPSKGASNRVEWARTLRERDRERVRAVAEGNEQGERRELLGRLSGAQSPLEAADARAEADRWIAKHPDDEEVRQVAEHLRPAEGEEDLGGERQGDEDLEEGSPT